MKKTILIPVLDQVREDLRDLAYMNRKQGIKPDSISELVRVAITLYLNSIKKGDV